MPMQSTNLRKERSEEENQTLSKRRRAKKIRLWEGGSLTRQDGQDLLDQKEAEQQLEQEQAKMEAAKGGPREANAALSSAGTLAIIYALINRL